MRTNMVLALLSMFPLRSCSKSYYHLCPSRVLGPPISLMGYMNRMYRCQDTKSTCCTRVEHLVVAVEAWICSSLGYLRLPYWCFFPPVTIQRGIPYSVGCHSSVLQQYKFQAINESSSIGPLGDSHTASQGPQVRTSEPETLPYFKFECRLTRMCTAQHRYAW